MSPPATIPPTATPAARSQHPATEVFGAFCTALRAAGVPVTTDRAHEFLRAVAVLGADDQQGVYWAGRATLCGEPDDLARYDQVFAAWFSGQALRPRSPREPASRVPQADLGADAADGDDGDEDPAAVHAAASTTEVLRHRDIAELSASERAALARMFAGLHPRPPQQSTARRRTARRGAVDARRTLREELQHGGEPARLRYHDRSTRPRRIVVLIDVSGSMGPYADSMLRWAHRLTRANVARTEVFTIGTRLTRVTRAMRVRDGEAALQAAGDTVPDWSGGTRLGESLQVFCDRWGQRGLARGAVVVILSDGWERGDATLLAEQMQRLHRLAHRIVWINPHRGKAGYQPVQSGITAALPYVDDFIAGHSMATFADALEVIARA